MSEDESKDFDGSPKGASKSMKRKKKGVKKQDGSSTSKSKQSNASASKPKGESGFSTQISFNKKRGSNLMGGTTKPTI
jgi:hypothetical protein